MGYVSPPSAVSEGTYCFSEGCSNIDSHIYSHIGSIRIGSWNVEGLTDVKVEQVIDYMIQYSIGVLCLQETRKSKSDVYLTSRGYKLILSGCSTSEREWAGVGFILSPKVCKSVAGGEFKAESTRRSFRSSLCICSPQLEIYYGTIGFLRWTEQAAGTNIYKWSQNYLRGLQCETWGSKTRRRTCSRGARLWQGGPAQS